MGLGDTFLDYADGGGQIDEFFLFEPWDITTRDPDSAEGRAVLNQIKMDGVGEKLREYEGDSNEFQSGIVYEYPRIGAIFAGTQVGKSYPVLMDIIIQSTGELPHALRFDKGEDTGIKRAVNWQNIRRFGRVDNATKEVLDYNDEAEEDGSWDCGTVKGCGKYPRKKMLKKHEVVWIGTFKQARDENWWKKLKELVPDHCLDKTRGTDGFANKDFIVYLTTGVEIHIITYEQGYERFESVKVARCVLDEEPPNEKIFNAALSHCYHLTLVETPYRGITFTYHNIKKVSGGSGDNSIRFYHCTQYDCPFKTIEEIEQERRMMPKWEIDARVYGLHSEQVGRPYFHDLYDVLHGWIRKFVNIGNRYDLSFPMMVESNHDAALHIPTAVRTADGAWEIFEEPRQDCAYWISADTARGDENADERVDANVAHIFRLPSLRGENPDRPVEVGSCRTQKETKFFARECVLAAAWFNNAMIAPEAKGFSAGTFINEIHGWPFMYTMTVTDDRTKKQVERIGFNTNVKTRQQIFDEIGDMINGEYDSEESPFRSKHTLTECASLIVGKGGRPDHGKRGTSDSLISFGIGVYVFKFDIHQIKNNINFRRIKNEKDVDTWGGRFVKQVKESRPVLGSRRGLDGRQQR